MLLYYKSEANYNLGLNLVLHSLTKAEGCLKITTKNEDTDVACTKTKSRPAGWVNR